MRGNSKAASKRQTTNPDQAEVSEREIDNALGTPNSWLVRVLVAVGLEFQVVFSLRSWLWGSQVMVSRWLIGGLSLLIAMMATQAAFSGIPSPL